MVMAPPIYKEFILETMGLFFILIQLAYSSYEQVKTRGYSGAPGWL